jgi:hypothetical protein
VRAGLDEEVRRPRIQLKFGNGNKLTFAFDRAGEKRVVDSFVERV